MRLTSKLLGWLSRAFDRDPVAFLGLRIDYAGPMQWQVADGILTTSVQTGPSLTIDLSVHTIGSLAGYVSLQPGYSVPFIAGADLSGASALRILEGKGDPGESNGDHLYVYTSPLFAFMDAYAVELAAAEAAIVAMPLELSTTTADGGWLDYLASYYAVPRQAGEMDGVFALRIIAEVLRPLGNNLAIEQAIADFTGQSVSIVDVVEYRAPEPSFDGTPHFDGTYHYQAQPTPVYGLFDAIVGYDLLSGSPIADEEARLRAVIERLRDAGTQLRALSLTGSVLSDVTPGVPTDDIDSLIITHGRHYDGAFHFDGSIRFGGSIVNTGGIATVAG